MPYQRVKTWIANNRYDFISISITLTALIFFQLLTPYMCYRNGLNNKPNFGTLFLMTLSQIVIFLALFIVSFINLLEDAFKAIKSNSVHWEKLLLNVWPLLIIILALLLFVFGKSGGYHYLRGYEKRVAKEANIPAIREWLNSIPTGYSGKASYEIEEYSQNIPEAINTLEHQYWRLSNFKDGRAIEIMLGGGFLEWGIRVGMNDMETPNKVGFVKITEDTRELRRPIEPGVYVFMRE